MFLVFKNYLANENLLRRVEEVDEDEDDEGSYVERRARKGEETKK